MEKADNKKQLRKRLVNISLVFIAAFVLSLALWLFVGKYYGYVITSISAHAIAPVKNLQLDLVKFDTKNKNNISTFFRTQKKLTKNVGLLQNVNFGHFTFNVPLTVGILAAFFPFIRKKRVYIEVAVLVITIHILYVFFLEGLKLSEALLRSGFEKPNEAKLVFWQFSEGFLKSMVLRFEPFLIGAYLYFSRTRGLEKQVEEIDVDEVDEIEEG
jgi:hypothetical protein